MSCKAYSVPSLVLSSWFSGPEGPVSIKNGPRKRNELVRMAAEIFVHTGRKAGDEISKEDFDQLLHSEVLFRWRLSIETLLVELFSA